MVVKLFEVRDRATFIPVMAVQLTVANQLRANSTEQADRERYLLRRAGYGLEQIEEQDNSEPYIILTRLSGDDIAAHYDPHTWTSRTMRAAHMHAIQRWDDLKSGDVLDVEYLLGETRAPKVSEQLTAPY